MIPSQQVVGLYSFPKSGNTWLRAIVAGIVGIPDGPGMLHKYVVDTYYGKATDSLWEYQDIDWFFYKSHHKNLLDDKEGEDLKTDKVVYIYRHPLDVFVSYLNFVSNNVSPNAGKSLNISFDKVEDLTPDEMEGLFNIYIDNATLFPQNKIFGSQFENIKNFENRRDAGEAVHILRYEDLSDNFEDEVLKICDFLGFKDVDIESVFASVEKRTKKNGKFFWRRKKENFREFLTDKQINRFMSVYHDEMNHLGYADLSRK